MLDVGCGAGTNLLYLAKAHYDAYGIDLAPGAIEATLERAREDRVALHAQVADALQLPFPASWFAGAHDRGCFHTIPFGRRRDYSTELSRVLRPDAGFQITWVAREHTSDFGPRHRPSLEEVTRAFEHDFIFEKVRFIPAVPKKNFAGYVGWLRRRRRPQPPRR